MYTDDGEFVKFTPEEEAMAPHAKVHEGGRVLSGIRQELRYLSKAARTFGLYDYSDRLLVMADDMEHAHHLIKQGFNEEFAGHCDAVQQGTANMVRGMLAVAIGMESKS